MRGKSGGLRMWSVLLIALALSGSSVIVAERPAAAQGCSAATEPDDAPESALPIAGPGCVTGELTEADNADQLLWTVKPEQAGQRWDVSLATPTGAPAILVVSRVLSDTAAPTLSLEPGIVELRTESSGAEPVEWNDLWLGPGRYLLTIGPGGPWNGTATTWEVGIELGTPLPAPDDEEPNDEAAAAVPVVGDFELSGDLAGTDDYYEWQVDPLRRGLWTLEAQGAMGVGLALTITHADGTVVGDARSEPDGVARLPDLRLGPGVHTIRLVGTAEPATPYVLRAYTEEVVIADPEPNDDPARALPLTPGQLVTGRLARPGDRDAYRISVQGALGSALLDARLIVQTGPPRRLCLSRLAPVDGGAEEVLELSCDEGPRGASLTGLLLEPGDYQVMVSGAESLIDPYYLRLDSSVAPAAGYEVEPNDTPSLATRMLATEPMRGRLDNADHFRVHVDGEPQLWQVEARGPEVRLTWVRTDGYAQGIGSDPDGMRERSVLTDTYLIPGDHWFRLDGSGDYVLTLEPLGPPDPEGEREPNDGLSLANTLTMDRSITGRLGSRADRDVFRFSLAAREHVRLTLDPPPDLLYRLYGAGDTGDLLSYRETPGPGEPLELDVVLPAGDHAVEVVGPASDERYRLSLHRLDPFDLAVDQEPNDEPAMAVAMPRSLRAEGSLDPGDGSDWYRLVPLPSAGELAVRTEGQITSLIIDDGVLQTALAADADGATYRSLPLPAGADVSLGVMADGPYALEVDPGATGLVATTVESELPLEVGLEIEKAEVAAFEAAGQRLAGRLMLTNGGDQPLDLRVDAAVSHPDWIVAFEVVEVALGPGVSRDVPLTVVVPAGAWADRSTRVTVRARSEDGQATAFAEVTPRADAPLVDPFRWWAVPDDLLGGLDVAATGLGAMPLPSVDPVAEATLHDGVVALGTGMDLSASPQLTLTVDLAGDEPVPVAGTILDPTAGPGAVAGTVRAFELLLSADGATYETVLRGELSGALEEQAFVLPQAIPARFAQLRVVTRYPGAPGIRLGEWKVVATPGWMPQGGPVDLTEPGLGGHIVWFDPQPGSPGMLDAMLVPDGGQEALLSFDARETSAATWVIGFQDGRAALLTHLTWIDPPGSRPDLRLSRLDLAGSMEGPLGPWIPMGTWKLERDGAGAVTPFILEAPAWARYIRMSGPIRDPASSILELPDAIQVFEQAPSDEYLSVIGEWGYGTPAGPYEWRQQTPDAPSCPERDTTPRADDGHLLEPGMPAGGCVARGTVAHAYAFTVPDGQRSVRFTVSGRPTVGVGLTLRDEAGAEAPLVPSPSDVPGAIDHVAAVTPGAHYVLGVEQPPFSVVVLFDTSGSVSPFVPIMTTALRSYLRGIVPGEEALQLFDLEGPPLPEEFSDDPWLILNALDAHAGSITGSSNAEIGLMDGLDALAGRAGTRAVFLMTDAETGSFHRQSALWRWLGLVAPRVFTMQVSGWSLPRLHERLMQDWAAVGGGAYELTRSGADIERAFEQMATWLRRPADYELIMDFSSDPPAEPKPGTLRVLSDPNAPADDDERAARSAADVAVEIVLDTSGSMLEKLGRKRRIEVAKSVLARLVDEELDPGTPVAVRVFRQAPDSCDSELAVPLGPLDPDSMKATISALDIQESVRTPLAKAISAVADDLAGVTGTRIVIVLSDGQESCDGDPEAAVQELVDQGFDVSVNVVGLDLDRKSRRRIARLAQIGGGTYYDARDADGLARALTGALGAPYIVLDAAGETVARGTVDGPPVELPPGTYRVSLAGASTALDTVVIESEDRKTVVVPA